MHDNQIEKVIQIELVTLNITRCVTAHSRNGCHPHACVGAREAVATAAYLNISAGLFECICIWIVTGISSNIICYASRFLLLFLLLLFILKRPSSHSWRGRAPSISSTF